MGKEFYTCDDRIYCMEDGRSVEVTERDRELLDSLLSDVGTFYPDAMKALEECYRCAELNVGYHRFLMARRFLKCNFGSLDTHSDDVDDAGVYHFEKVACPLRGECRHEGRICMPRFNCRLSDAELRVMREYYDEKDVEVIAARLYLSGHTVKNHIKAAYSKLGVHTRGEFIGYASKHNIFG